jgi:hypothetical protein
MPCRIHNMRDQSPSLYANRTYPHSERQIMQKRRCIESSLQPKRDSSVTPQHTLNKLSKRTKPLCLLAAFLVRQVELLNKQHEMLEASVKMRLQTESSNHTVVMAVYVCVNTVESLKEHLHCLLKAFREWHARLSGKDAGVAEVVRCPG